MTDPRARNFVAQPASVPRLLSKPEENNDVRRASIEPLLAPLGLQLVTRNLHRRTVYGVANGYGIILAESPFFNYLDVWQGELDRTI